jgi:hypothetical protein
MFSFTAMHTEITPLTSGEAHIPRMPRRDIGEIVILFYKGNRFRGKIVNASASGLLIETDAQPSPKINDDFLLLFRMETDAGSMGKLAVKTVVSRLAGKQSSKLSHYGLVWQSAECDTTPAPLQTFKKRIVPDAGGVIRVQPPTEKHPSRRFTYTFSSGSMLTTPPQKDVPVTAPKAEKPSPIELKMPESPTLETSEAFPMPGSVEQEEKISESPVVEMSEVIPINKPLKKAEIPTQKHLQGKSIQLSGEPGTLSPSRDSNEKRSSPRTVQLISIEYAHRGSRNTGFLTDISRGGAFIQTREQLPPLESVLSISIKVDRYPIRISARVTRQIVSESLGDPAGFGIEFLPHKDPYRQDELMRAIETMT